MKELIERLKSKANLTDEQATKAAEVVRNFLNDKLPASLSGPVQSALTGENVQEAAGKAKEMLGGIGSSRA